MVKIALNELVTLLQYYWAAVNSKKIGELGLKPYEEVLNDIDKQSRVVITTDQLKNLVYHAKEVIMNRVEPVRVNYKARSYHPIMEKLADQAPHLFYTKPTGEIVFKDEK